MNIGRITLTVGAATGGVLAAGFLQTAIAFAAPTPPDPFTEFANYFGSGAQAPQLANLDAVLDAQSPGAASTLLADVNILEDGENLAISGNTVPPTDDAFVELASTGYALGNAMTQNLAVELDNVLYTLDPNEAPILAADATPPTIAAGDTLTLFNPFTLNPNMNVDAVNGIPPLYQDITGNQTFTVDDTTGQGTATYAVPVGTITTGFSQYTFMGGDTNTEYTVATFNAGTDVPISSTTDQHISLTNLPADGSVYDTFNFGNGLENVYTDLVSSTGTNTVTDFLTYNGTDILNLSSLAEAFSVPAADLGYTSI